MDIKKIIKPLIGIALIIVISTVIVKLLTGPGTLKDYAEANPEIAYATPEPIPDNDNLPADGSNDDSVNTIDQVEATSLVVSTPTSAVAPTPTASLKPDLGSSTEDKDIEIGGNIYDESFYYTEITDDVKERIVGISYPSDDEGISITLDDLRYLRVKYYDFYDEVREGEIICNKYIADDLSEIFCELYKNGYQIESIKLIDEFGGDDTLSMEHNNTSCFNYRGVDFSTSLSKHAYGLAIDINPFYNPYIVFGKGTDGGDYISPKGSEIYVDRSLDFDHKIDKNDLCYQLFKERGFTWGGDWNSCKDYQHFQKVPN